MYIGFSKTLIRLGGIRFGVGKRLKGSAAGVMVLFYGMMQLFWWALVGTLWLLYGFGYVFIYLPVKAIKKLLKKEQ